MDSIREMQERAVNDTLTTAPARLGRILPYLTRTTMDELFSALVHQAVQDSRATTTPEFTEIDP